MQLLKAIGLGFAAAALASWVGMSTASAKPPYKTATGKDCATCHDGPKPYKKDKLTDKGKAFEACMKSGKTADACKDKVK
jgi:hypothetical protein